MVDNSDYSEKSTEVTQITQAFDIMDISLPNNQVQNNTINLDLLGGSNTQHQTNSNIADIFSIDLGMSQPQNVLANPNHSQLNTGYQQPNYQQPTYQQPGSQQANYYQSGYQQNLTEQFSLNSGYLTQSVHQSAYQNITLSTNE